MLVARTVGGLEALDDKIKAEGGSATLVPLDVTDGPGIDRLGAALYERFGSSTCFWAMPASWASSRRSAISILPCSSG